jgi:hypothetical protein
MRISGTFVYQPQTITMPHDGVEEYFPCAIAVGLVVLNEDGSPASSAASPVDVECSVVLSSPFVRGPSGGVRLVKVVQVAVVADNSGYVQLTYVLPRDTVDSLPAGWTPMAILATVNAEHEALLVAAPVPAVDTGILPPSGTHPASGGEKTQ